MKDIEQVLDQKSLVVVFAYIPAGLGHLRVTDAFFHGLPEGITPLLLGPEDKLTIFFHRLTSVNPVAKRILEWSQSGIPEDLFTRFYRWLYSLNTAILYQEMSLVLEQRMNLPKTVLVVATHYGLAYQIVQIKNKLEKEKHVKVITVLQVTDDSPQHFWYVPGVDLIISPSQETKEKLQEYGQSEGLGEVEIEVLPYPVDPVMGGELTGLEMKEKEGQLEFAGKSSIHLAIPISGAGVGLDFVTHLVDALYEKSERFIPYVICKSTPFTQDFLKEMMNRPYIKFNTSFSSREVVDQYEELYRSQLISLEVTKPSEQAFKALFTPRQRGGAILLFAEPVGRQEYDNLSFLRRHSLIPQKGETEKLHSGAKKNLKIDGGGKWIFKKAKHWRGLILPQGSKEAADFIFWALREGILQIMVSSYIYPKGQKQIRELGADGVKKFWTRVAQLVKDKS